MIVNHLLGRVILVRLLAHGSLQVLGRVANHGDLLAVLVCLQLRDLVRRQGAFGLVARALGQLSKDLHFDLRPFLRRAVRAGVHLVQRRFAGGAFVVVQQIFLIKSQIDLLARVAGRRCGRALGQQRRTGQVLRD